MNFKYKTSFSDHLKINNFFSSNSSFTSQASIDNLQSLIPEEIDFEKNIDLIGTAFNAAVINSFNKNGDGINTSTAKQIKDFFIHKPTNIEHNKRKVVGHIISSGYSEYNSDKILEDVPDDFSEKFNIALGALVYSNSFPEFADLLLKSNDQANTLYHSISASWELGFNEYHIAVGSQDLKDAEIVTDSKQIEELSEYLSSFDGDGTLEDGTPVFRLVVGEVYPLGIGFTSNPAADVKGLIIKKNNSENTEEIEAENETYKKKEIKKISQNEKIDVNNNINQISNMQNQELIEQFKSLLEEKMPEHNFSQEAVANIGRVIGDAIKSKSEQYEKELSDINSQKEELAAVEAKMKEDIESLKSQLTASEEKVQELAQQIEAKQKEEAFNSRMELIESIYELSADDKTMLAKEVQGLSTEGSGFDEYQDKLKVMWAHKNKEHITEQEKLFNEKVEAEIAKRAQEKTSSKEEVVENTSVVEEALANTEEEQSEVSTNNNLESAVEELSFREKFANAFAKETVTIKF
jgi:hypothetical protein